MILTYRYRLLPSKRQHAALAAICESQRQLYNAALEERIDCYRKTGKRRTFFDQAKALTPCRRDLPEMAALAINIQRWTLKRVDEAFNGFFRRVRARAGKAGFPRFRGKGRWNSFGFNEFQGSVRWDGKRLRFKGLTGGLRVHLHRPLPDDADIRCCVFRRDNSGWHVCFQTEIETAEKLAVTTAVGVDLGLKVFAYCSDGVVVPTPHIGRKVERELRRRQRALARCKRISNRRRKVKTRLARLHRKIANTRSTWLHQKSAALVNRADLIAAEGLNVAGMVQHPTLARSISDASWAKFLGMVSYKAERAGKTFVTVDPRNTSKRCSDCGELVPKALAVRTHACPHCGLVLDRDWNAARNILQAVVGLGQLNVAQWGERAAGNLGLSSGQDTTSRFDRN